MFSAGVRAYLMAARYAAPLMLPNRRGLIINLTFWDHEKKLDSIYYDLAMNANNRMAFDLAAELKEHFLYVGDLAKEYGFTDTDGRWIPP
ncbi:MAG: oxidoreductase, partial [Bacillota bacterium]